MKTVSLGFVLCHCLLPTSTLADEPAAPSIELLLYLADLDTDADGRPIDPLDLPDDRPQTAAGRPPPNTPSPRTSIPEYPR